MPAVKVTPLRIPLEGGGSLSGTLCEAPDAVAAYVFAHGAGADMNHAFMSDLSAALAERRVSTLRFQFPFIENGSGRPDAPAAAQAAVRAAVLLARTRLPALPLFAGGKSFGGRMTSMAQAERALAGVLGLAFVGFPLHPAGKPAVARAAHLHQVSIPMLFMQGTRDALAQVELIQEATEALGPRARLHVVDGADHAFHVLVRSGRKDTDVMGELADAMAQWMAGVRAGA